MIGLGYLGLGAVAGILAGLLGVGGGLVIVPVLLWLFVQQGLATELTMHLAVGTSLATIVVTSLSSIYAHHRRGAILWGVWSRMGPGVLLGALLGALLARYIPSEGLRTFFALFELAVALQMGLNLRPASHWGVPGAVLAFLAGGVIGMISALVGVGGGTMTVPFLLWCNVPVRQAVATSAAVGLPIAVAGMAGFMLAGQGQAGLPAWSSGFVYWPAWLGIVAASVLFAPLGARWAHTLPTAVLKRVFAIFLAILAGYMLLG